MSDVERPMAPSRMAWSTMRSISRISSAVGGRLTSPMTISRGFDAPTKKAKLIALPFFSRVAKYWPSVVHGARSFGGASESLTAGLTGPGECPSPVTSVVTPWRTLASTCGSRSTEYCDWPRRSMKPGATTLSCASSVAVAAVEERSPMATSVSPRTPPSARDHLAVGVARKDVARLAEVAGHHELLLRGVALQRVDDVVVRAVLRRPHEVIEPRVAADPERARAEPLRRDAREQRPPLGHDV